MLYIKQRGTASLVDPSRKKVPYQSLKGGMGRFDTTVLTLFKNNDDDSKRSREYRKKAEPCARNG